MIVQLAIGSLVISMTVIVEAIFISGARGVDADRHLAGPSVAWATDRFRSHWRDLVTDGRSQRWRLDMGGNVSDAWYFRRL